MYSWTSKKIKLNFKNDWVIHGGSASSKTNTFLIVKKDNLEGWGEISASTKNNDLPVITNDLNRINLNSIQSLVDINHLNCCPQVKAGLELAWFHLQSKLLNINIYKQLNVAKTTSSLTNFSIPILSPEQSVKYLTDLNVSRFKSCKIKINDLTSIDSVFSIANNFKGSIRIDGNECFKNANQALEFINKVKSLNIDFIEQPLHRDNYEEAKKLKLKSSLTLIGDESLQNNDVTAAHKECFHGLNIKLMKAGGYQQAVNQLQQCDKLGLKKMIGCMVETSLNVSAALTISAGCDWADLDGYLLLKDDPFLILSESEGIISLNNLL